MSTTSELMQAEDLGKLILDLHSRYPDGKHLAIDGLRYTVHKKPMLELNCFYDLSIALILSGDKKVKVGSMNFAYGKGSSLVTVADVPSSFELYNISAQTPFISTSLKLNPILISELLQTQPEILKKHQESKDNRIFIVSTITEELANAFSRLLKLLNKPDQITILAPMIIREIHYYLLISPDGGPLTLFYRQDSMASRINKTISWIRSHYKEPLDPEKLASIANMTLSTFYRHFKELTTVTPLQYQKRLCLYEAQHLMLAKGFTALQAAYEVGYQSPQQFSREYKREFGVSPRKSIQELLDQAN